MKRLEQRYARFPAGTVSTSDEKISTRDESQSGHTRRTLLISEPACPLSSLVTFELPAFTDRNGKKHNARYCYTSVSAKNGAVRVRWVHAGSSGQRRTRLLSTNPLLEEAPLSYLQHLEVCEPKHYAELLHATFGTAPTGTMQKAFSLQCASR